MIHTKLIYLVFILLCSAGSFAEEIPVLKLTSRENVFVVNQKKGIDAKTRFYIYEGNRLSALGEFIYCKNNRCLGEVTRKVRTFELKESLKLSLTPRVKKKKVVQETPRLPTPTPVREDKFHHSIAGQYGGPLTSSISANYILSKDKLSYYAGIGTLFGKVSDVNLSGYGVTGGASYEYHQHGKLKLLAKFLLDIYSANLDFTVSRTSFEESVLFFNGQFLQTFEYQFDRKFSVGLDVGYAINTLDKEYKNSLGDSLTISFSGGIFQANLFARYFF